MVKAVGNGAVRAAQPFSNYGSADIAAEMQSPQIAEMVAAALTRLRRDLETFHPNKPALAYALAGETHVAMLQRWRHHPPAAQTALLVAFLKETSELLRQLQARTARIGPTNGYMFGLQDEAIKLEVQADITLEEIRRIEADIHELELGEALQ
jgi:hypothetical protein